MAPLTCIALALAAGASAIASYGSNRPSYIGRFPMTGGMYDQSFLEGYSILKHIGGWGPYSNRQSWGIGRDPPEQCAVDQVVMLRRHGERYPQPSDRVNVQAALDKVYSANISEWKGDLHFLNSWTYWVDDDGLYGLETETGPYNGLLQSYRHGAEYRTRYGHLWDAKAKNITPMWSADYERIVQTARKFGEGFFGRNYTDSVALNLVSEDPEMGANSLTPLCPATNQTKCKEVRADHDWPIFRVAADRLNQQNDGLKLNSTDIFHLMFQATFELNVRGYSEWTDAFTLDEWKVFGYTQDLDFWYCAGPGDSLWKNTGSVYANASLQLLKQGPDKVGKLIFNFSHDTDITKILYAMGIAVPRHNLTREKIPFPNEYQIGNIMPMGGHLTVERLACNKTTITPEGTYVRIVLNEAVVPFDDCQDGPGWSCSLANYTKKMESELPEYFETCKINSTLPRYIDFWWNYNTSTRWNHQGSGDIPYNGEHTL